MDDPILHDIPDPSPWLPGVPLPAWAWIAIGLLTVLVLAVIAVLILRKKPAPPPDLAAVYEESCRKLKALRADLAGRPLAEVATAASFAVREYLAAALEEPALFETHEELTARHDAFAKLPAGARERLAPLLDRLAASKYGRTEQDDAAATELVDNSLKVLDGLESTRPRVVA
ncbi:MAG: hypothetical protein HKN82_00780 [Akkermansiaceae bacterium]|nr:hypothetical protein [Akkermansiaceae bacterium]